MEQLKEKLRALWAEIQARYAEAQGRFMALTERERTMVVSLAGVFAAVLLFVIFFSLSSAGSSTQSRTTTKLLKLQQLQLLAASYHEAQGAREAAERALSTSNVSLLSYLEETGKRAGLDIPTMSPKGDVAIGDEGKIIESSVELTLTDVSLDKLLAFLSAVERGPGVLKVRYLRIEPRPANEVLTAWATVSTYRLKAGGP